MKSLENNHIVDLINKILADPGDEIPHDLTFELAGYLSDSTLVSPVDENGNIIQLGIGPNTFIPASCDIEDFKRIFKDTKYDLFEFKDLYEFIDDEVDGIIINPGSFGFIVNLAFLDLISRKIEDNQRAPVKKGYDVKVRLNNFRPLTWRDLIIPENITFDELDDILKTLWGFNGYHLSSFFIKAYNLDIMDKKISQDSMIDADYDTNTTLINDFFDNYNKITYWYDFGDNWQFDIEIKKKIDYDKNYVTIKRYKGKYNPIEDCKGPYGLSEIVYYAENPDEKDDSYFCELVEYLEEFDMEETQSLLKNKLYVTSMWK